VSASVNLPLHHKVQKFSSGTISPGWSWKKGHTTVVVCYYACLKDIVTTLEFADMSLLRKRCLLTARAHTVTKQLLNYFSCLNF